MSDDDAERTHEPTPQRREQFRKDGRYARARDAGGIAASLAVGAVLLGSRGVLSRTATFLFTSSHGDLAGLGRLGPRHVLLLSGSVVGTMAGPALLAGTTAAVMISIAQSGVRIQTDTLGFKFERLNPIEGFKRLLSFKQGMTEVLLGLLRVVLIAAVAWRALEHDLPSLVSLARVPADAAIARSVEVITKVAMHALFALTVVAAADYGWSWWKIQSEMKMTRREVMDESRSQEGDAKLKGKRKAIARAMLRKRSIANVRKADVVVTNPTHIAVALRYSKGDAAPVVIAKGHDGVAMLIRREARKHGVPILENRPLARALDAEVQIGQMVPGKHFVAVARVLAWVYRIKPSARRVNGNRP